jgi:formylmethanofuran dehydrogenase subunit E
MHNEKQITHRCEDCGHDTPEDDAIDLCYGWVCEPCANGGVSTRDEWRAEYAACYGGRE